MQQYLTGLNGKRLRYTSNNTWPRIKTLKHHYINMKLRKHSKYAFERPRNVAVYMYISRYHLRVILWQVHETRATGVSKVCMMKVM